MIQGIRHVGLVVEDTEKALSFYRDLLGFEVYWDKLEEGKFVETILGFSPLKVRTIKMKAKSGCILELLCYDPCACVESLKNIFQSGFTHIALTVSDMDAIVTLLKKNGAIFVSAPQTSSDKKVKVLFCRDFEGNFLELVQELG